jgi:cytochrome P450
MPSADAPWLSIDPRTRTVSIDSSHPGFYGDPYSTYERIRPVAPAFLWSELGIWCFLSMADVSAILRDRRFGRELLPAPGAPAPVPREAPAHLAAFNRFNETSMLEREPPVHTRLRNIVSRAFLTRNIERLRPRIGALASSLAEAVRPRREAELISAFATPIPVTVIAELLGVPGEMAPQLLGWSHRMVAIYQLDRTRRTEDEAEAATREFSEFIRGYAEKRRRSPADDLITHLIASESAGDRLSEDELVGTCILLLNAGHEATVHAIGNSVKTLLEQGTDLSRAFADDAATERTVEECLRFDPPLHLFRRFVQEDLEVAGVRLSRGDEVALLYGAANRDPARYPNPGLFDPTRPTQGGATAHASFGGGIHFCLGAPLARLELQVALPILFRALPGIRLAEIPRYRDVYHFHGLEALRATWP